MCNASVYLIDILRCLLTKRGGVQNGLKPNVNFMAFIIDHVIFIVFFKLLLFVDGIISVIDVPK